MNPTGTQRIVFFDFDGVIIRSFDMSFSVHKLLHPNHTITQYLKWFEGNIHKTLKADNVASTRLDEQGVALDYHTEYAKRIKDLSIEDAMSEVVRILATHHTLIIVSSTPSSIIREFLEVHGILTCFKEILGSDVHKNKVIKMEQALQREHVAPHDAVMITDTLGDIREAELAGVAAIGVTWGFHPKDTLLRGNPFAIAETPADVPVLVEQYFNSRNEA